MKIKCPGCSATLNIPQSAAGKVVKCSCGKQLVAPAAPAAVQSANSAGPARPGTSNSAVAAGPKRTSPPAVPPTQRASSTAFDPKDFDDLTEGDLQPVRSVNRPGVVVDTPRTAENEILMRVSGEKNGSPKRPEGSHPSGLQALGGLNFGLAIWHTLLLVCILGLANLVEVPRALQGAKGTVMGLIIAMFAVDILLCVLAGVSCFLNWKRCWLFLLFAFSFSLIIRIVETIDSVRLEAGATAIAISALSALLTLIGIAYLHGEEVKKFYKTKTIKWSWPLIADAAGCGLAGALAIGYFVLSR